MKNKDQALKWYQTQKIKDTEELEREKKQLIDNIKKIKKTEMFADKKEKLTIWQRIKKVLMGI